MKRLEHIGIAVRDLDEANALFEKLLGCSHYKVEEVPSEGVRVSFFNVSGVKFELLAPTRPDSAISRHIEKRGEGVHHVAFEVDDLEQAIADHETMGFAPINPVPSPGADNKRICFLHPKSTGGVLVELCQERAVSGSAGR
ncbi:MAG: methylmalonyl-CoA epimerase [Bacteroidota bacterium]|jgi:methylmalonyl-CoA/ethylmalonyl-CoA epimerase